MEAIDLAVKELELRNVDGTSKIYRFPAQLYGLTNLEVEAVRNTIEPFRIGIDVFDLLEISIKNLTFCWPTTIEGIEVIQVVDIIDNVGYIHSVTPHVIQSASVRYIIENFATTDNRVQNGVRIARLNPGIPCLSTKFRVYKSLRKLKKDPLFQQITGKKRQSILKESNISTVADFIFTKSEDKFDGHFIQHLFLGSFKKGKATGVHHIMPILRGHVQVITITKSTNKLGVWEAKIRVQDKGNKQTKEDDLWKNKDQLSTFFPNNWNTLKLLDECESALKVKQQVKEVHNQILWRSKTTSGIPVEIWTDKNQKPVSIYPIWEPD